MKLKIVFFLFVLLCSSSLFAKATTDLKLGGMYGYNNTTQTDYDIKTEHNLIGFGAGCDVELNKHFGLFIDLDFLFPLEKENNFDLFGLITVPDLKFYTHSVEGVEFVQYFNDNVKMRIGGLLAVEQKFYKAGSDSLVETFVGPGAKFDTIPSARARMRSAPSPPRPPWEIALPWRGACGRWRSWTSSASSST